MSQKCKVEIIINNISDKMVKAVEKSLSPDNVNFPNDLIMNVEKIDNKLVFSFSNNGNMGKLITTVDEVLEHANLALEVIK